VYEDRADAFLEKKVSGVTAKAGDVVCFGHTHIPWYRVVGGVHFVNTGSVGRPKDGDWRATYVLLSVTSDAVNVEIVRVEYDVELAARAILAGTLPHEFAEQLRTGGQAAAPANG
jgi:diadenosine tetraphosphatase ApaH/serine/threonine PP2A family protein phosphatase